MFCEPVDILFVEERSILCLRLPMLSKVVDQKDWLELLVILEQFLPFVFDSGRSTNHCSQGPFPGKGSDQKLNFRS